PLLYQSLSSISTLYTFRFFFNDTATTDIYTLSLHDALPISRPAAPGDDVELLVCRSESLNKPLDRNAVDQEGSLANKQRSSQRSDRKSTRLNSSHVAISYAVFCLKKKR